jgi:uncharacterized membrane protein YeaQ/YmgE (transglycosylase-associated protein family)
MNHRTKGIVAGCVGMMSGGFVNSLLASSELGISSLLKAAIVGFVAGAVVLLMLAVLPVRKNA